MVKYSLLLPVRNEARRIEAVARGVFADLPRDRGGDPDWEVLIADDGSDDGTREKLAALARELPFRLLAPPKNLGRGPIRNLLAAEARGAHLVFVDGDCVVAPGFFRAWEGVDAGCAWMGRVEYVNDPPCGLTRFLGQGSGMAKRRRASGVPPAYFISQNFRVPAEAFRAAGGFRADLTGWGGEDTDLAYKLSGLGLPLRYNDAAAVRHPSVTDVAAYLERLERFGKTNLPALVAEHPELAGQFKLPLARFPFSLLFLNPLLFAAARYPITRWKALPWQFSLYRYAIFNSYARGWRASRGG